MDHAQELAKILSSSSSIHTVGENSFARRPLGQKIKSLCATGLLSAVVVLQILNPVLAHAPTQATPPTTQSQQVQQENTLSPFLVNPSEKMESAQAFLDDNGVLDTSQVIKHWSSHDISQKNILKLAQLMFVTQGPVFVTSQNDLQKVEGLAERTQGMFSLQDNNQAEVFLKRYDLSKLAKAGLVPPSQAFVNDNAPLSNQTPQQLLQNTIDGLKTSSVSVDFKNKAVSFDKAVSNLATAVSQTGLRSLKIPLPSWTSPIHLNNIASNLTKANSELEHATGFSGKMFQVGQGIDLVLGVPQGHGGLSITQVQHDGRIHMETEAASLAHEVFHAWFSSSTDKAFVDSLNNLDKQLEEKSSVFANSYYTQAETLKEDYQGYFQKTTERLAYQFSAYVFALNQGKDLVSSDAYSIQGASTQHLAKPSLEEAQALIPVWQQALPQLKQPNWQSPSQVGLDVQVDISPSPLSASLLRNKLSNTTKTDSHPKVNIAP